jgi:hypothetical protein
MEISSLALQRKSPMSRLMLLIGLVIMGVVAAVGATFINSNQAHALSVPAPAPSRDQSSVQEKAGLAEAGAIRRGAMIIRVLNSFTARRIASQYFDSTASGVYVIVKLAATNDTTQPLTLPANALRLRVGSIEYAPDPGSDTALELGGRAEFSASDVTPATTISGWIAFDVPLSIVRSRSQICIAMLGSTSTVGCMPSDPK